MSKKVSAISSGTPTTDDKILMVDATTDALYLATLLSILSDLVLTKLATGFSIAGGSTPKTLTVDADATISTIQSDISTAQGAITTLQGNRVQTTGDETIAGVKTFSSFPVTPSEAPTTDYQTSNKKYVDDAAFAGVPDATEATKGKAELATQAETDTGTDDARIVTPLKLATTTKIPAGVVSALSGKCANSGDETWAGVKTFGSIPVLPASNPTTDNQAVRKAYVDYKAGALLLGSADTERSASNANYAEKKRFTLLRSGYYRIAFDYKDTVNASDSFGIKLRKNGSDIAGTEITTAVTTSYQTATADLGPFAAGDYISLVLRETNSLRTGYCRNFRFSVAEKEGITVTTD